IERADVSGEVPAAAKHFARQIVATEISDRDVRTANDDEPRLSRRERLRALRIEVRVRIDDAHAHTRQRMPDGAAARARLEEAGRAVIRDADGDRGRALRRAIRRERPDAEVIPEGESERLGEPL